MKKIPTVLVRNPDDRAHVLMQVTPGCEWVFAGEGIATRKYDGTCMKFDGGMWWARREVKPGKQPPNHYVAEETDEVTGKTVGWEPAMNSAFIKFLNEAIKNADRHWHEFPIGTYELCGPKINGNPEGYDGHYLVSHSGAMRFLSFDHPSDPASLCEWMKDLGPVEGIVWHHRDGRMAKLKVKDIPDA